MDFRNITTYDHRKPPTGKGIAGMDKNGYWNGAAEAAALGPGVSRNTIKAALQNLVKRGWFTLHGTGRGLSTRAGETPFCNVCVGSRSRNAPFWAGFHEKGTVAMPAGPCFDRNYRHGRYFLGVSGPWLSVYRHQRCIFGPERSPAPDPAPETRGKEGSATDTGVANYRHGRYFNPLHYRH